LDDGVDVFVAIGDDQLEGPEQLLAASLKVLDELVERHFHCGGLIGAVNIWDEVIGQGLAS
jgi:hypothetical protein